MVSCVTFEIGFLRFSVLKILMFLCYANEESDDVVNCGTKMVKYSVKTRDYP